MRHSEPSLLCLRPVFGLAIALCVRRDHLSFEHHGVDIEVIIVTNSKKPDVLRTILPVRLCAASFLTFPRDPVLGNEIFLTDALDCRRTPPIAADVNRRGGFQ